MPDSMMTNGQPDMNPHDGGDHEAKPDEQYAEDTDSQPNLVEIDGREYPVDEVKEWMQGGLRQQDYTRKTQALAEERRELERQREDLERQREEMLRMGSQGRDDTGLDVGFDETTDDVEVLNRRLAALDQKITKVVSGWERKEQEELAAREEAEAQRRLDEGLSKLENRPFFDRREVAQFMLNAGLRPGQEEVAYRALYGDRIGRKIGELAATSRGASARPVMGTGQTAISPGFTHPMEVPGAGEDLRNLTPAQLRDLAMNDPELRSLD